MGEAGIFRPDERVELIEGEIVQMSPISPRHAGCVINAIRLFITRPGDRAIVSPQNPVVIEPRSEPQPDLLLLRPRAVSYSRGHPTPADVLLAVEVADTTARFDRLVKARLYARGSPGVLALPGARSRRRGSPCTRLRRLRQPDGVQTRPDGVAARVSRRRLRRDRLLRLTPVARSRRDQPRLVRTGAVPPAARHRYHAATDRYGCHRSPSRRSALGVGRVRLPHARR